MAPFAFTDPYPAQDDSAGSEADSEFEIDSTISDIDVQNLFDEVKQFNVLGLRRDLADATIALQERMWKHWSKYAGSIHKDPEKLMRKRDPKVFILFLEWHRKNNPRANRLTTYESLWKQIRELYYDRCKMRMPDDISGPVTNYLQLNERPQTTKLGGRIQDA